MTLIHSHLYIITLNSRCTVLGRYLLPASIVTLTLQIGLLKRSRRLYWTIGGKLKPGTQ